MKAPTEAEKLQAENASLQQTIRTLERKLALAYRASEQRALAEREKWMTAIGPEVGVIQQRILDRMR